MNPCDRQLVASKMSVAPATPQLEDHRQFPQLRLPSTAASAFRRLMPVSRMPASAGSRPAASSVARFGAERAAMATASSGASRTPAPAAVASFASRRMAAGGARSMFGDAGRASTMSPLLTWHTAVVNNRSAGQSAALQIATAAAGLVPMIFTSATCA